MIFLTISEIVDDILETENIFTSEQKAAYKDIEVQDLIKVQPTVGKKISNVYELWHTDNPLIFGVDGKMSIQPKDLTYIIMRLIWEQLNINNYAVS